MTQSDQPVTSPGEPVVRKRKRQRRADRPGTDDDEIMEHRAPPAAALADYSLTAELRGDANRRPLQRGRQRSHAASTSLRVFGVAAVRFSLPAAVTSTSSSMRTPISQNSSGTLSAGRM